MAVQIPNGRADGPLRRRTRGRGSSWRGAKGPGLVFAPFQKYRTEVDVAEVTNGPAFEVLNHNEAILVLGDEAHPTQAGDLHAKLMAALPNCARIRFTGTSIVIGEKETDGAGHR